MTSVVSSHSRRALRMYVKLTGPLMVRGGYTRRVDSAGGFVSCEPVFAAGDTVEMELMLNPSKSAGVKVMAEVLALQDGGERERGLELRWIEAQTMRSPAALQRFLSTVLGVMDPAILEGGSGAYTHRYVFPDRHRVRVGSAFEAMKSRPIGKGRRRTVMHTDPNMGPAKLSDVLGGAPDPQPTMSVAAPARDDGFNVQTDTIPEMGDEALEPIEQIAVSAPVEEAPEPVEEEEIVEDDLVPYDMPMTPKAPALEKPITMRGSIIEDRRQRERLSLFVPVSYFLNSRGTVGRAHNVSRSGLYIETSEKPPKVGSRLNVRFPVRHGGRNHVVLLTCEVTRHRAPREKPGTKHGFAVHYLVVDELGRMGVFSHFINQHL